MAGRGRPVTIKCDHVAPDITGYNIGERYECDSCTYKWVVTKSPIGNKNFWRELGK